MPEDGWDEVLKTRIKHGWAIRIIDFTGLYLSFRLFRLLTYYNA